MASGLVFNIQRYSLQDGPGIRTTVFLKGCPLSCWWCHNPESQSATPQVVTMETRCMQCGECRQVCPNGQKADRCIRCGACVQACPTGARQLVGKEMSVSHVMEEVLRDRIFYEDSGGGVTMSGGEPLVQPQFTIALLKACRNESLHTALDTCGFANQADLLNAAALSDLVLYDLKMLDDARHVEYTGVSNGRIIANLRALAQTHKNVWLRIPIVPGLNDTEADLNAAGELAQTLPGVRRISLLSYHKIGAQKYQRLGKEYLLEDVQPPPSSRMEELAARIRGFGKEATIDG